MHIEPDCVTCIFSQSLKVANKLNLDQEMTKTVMNETAKMIPSFDHAKNPPQNAAPVYEMIARLLKKEDIYKEIKQESIEHAKSFVSLCKDKIKESENKLLTATKIAVAGNVIDLAAEFSFDLGEELEKILDMEFGIDDYEKLSAKLYGAKKLVYLADNAGENIFDKIYIETIKEFCPDMKVYCFVRGNPIINDITEKEAYDSGLNEVSTIINSGVPTPGLDMGAMSKEAKEIFESAECIISKGMGNYECLSEEGGYPIFFLLKVKCQVVARSLKSEIGDIVCKKL